MMPAIVGRNILRELNGVCCIYKPSLVSKHYILDKFRTQLCKDANEKYQRPPVDILDINNDEGEITVKLRPSYMDNVLVSGPRFVKDDMSLAVSPLSSKASGVCAMGINYGITDLNKLMKYNPMKVYQIKGVLGVATQFLFKDQKVVARVKVKNAHMNTMEKILSSFQSSHHRKAFFSLGIDMQSQKAYELACQGMLKPYSKDTPFIYSIKCIEFDAPNFTIEVKCMNDTEDYLLRLIYEIGLKFRTVAHCTGIRCIRYGPFTVKDSLIPQEWTLQTIKHNIRNCEPLLRYVFENARKDFLQPVNDSESHSPLEVASK
ncbi:UNVERIFIED_CONTAM: hypothetical protein PYX00_003865 [Menopon gallinae]|uniref:Pseudouridine synthase II N-terminal domain-containing protein n=1 Tax=Menopon gallinae TaxID=328185 RepID=A0AAW2I277_9NEOP